MPQGRKNTEVRLSEASGKPAALLNCLFLFHTFIDDSDVVVVAFQGVFDQVVIAALVLDNDIVVIAAVGAVGFAIRRYYYLLRILGGYGRVIGVLDFPLRRGGPPAQRRPAPARGGAWRPGLRHARLGISDT